MRDIEESTKGCPSTEKRTDWDLQRNLARRAVPDGDDLRGAGIRLATATAAVSVISPTLTQGTRYKWRCVDTAAAPGGVHHIRTTTTATAAPATAADFPVRNGDQGYLFVPQDGAWNAVSFLGDAVTATLYLMEAREKEETLL